MILPLNYSRVLMNLDIATRWEAQVVVGSGMSCQCYNPVKISMAGSLTKPRVTVFPFLVAFLLAFASALGQTLYPLQPKLEVAFQTGHMAKVNAVAFSRDGRRIASASEDHTVKIWDAATGAEVRTLREHAAAVEAEIATQFGGKRPCTPWPECTGSGQAGVLAVAFSNDGRLVTSASSRRIVVSEVATGREVRSFAAPPIGSPAIVALSSDGRWLAAVSFSGGPQASVLTLWDVEKGQEARSFRGGAFKVFSAVAFSPDARVLAAGNRDGVIQLWDIAKGSELRNLSRHETEVQSITFSPDGMLIATAGREYAIKIWEAATGNLRGTLQAYTDALVFSPDGRLLCAVGAQPPVGPARDSRLFDVASAKETQVVKALANPMAFSPDGTRLVGAVGLGPLEVREIGSGRELAKLGTSPKGFAQVAFSSDGQYVALGAMDNTVRLLDVAAQKQVRMLSGHSGGIQALAFTPDGRLVVSGGADGIVKVWEVATGRPMQSFVAATPREIVERPMLLVNGRLVPHGEPRKRSLPVSISSVASSPDSRSLATAAGDGTVKIWDVATGRETRSIAAFTGDGAGAGMVVFSPDGLSLVATGREARDVVKMWDVATGRELRRVETEKLVAVGFAAQGRLVIANSSPQGKVRVWDAVSGRDEAAPIPLQRSDRKIAFSFDGRWMFSGAYLSEVATGREIGTLGGLRAAIGDVAFSPDGRWLLSGGHDSIVRFWPLALESLREVAAGHTAPVFSLAFSPDGRSLASASGDGTVGLWAMDTGRLVRFLGAHKGPVLAVAFTADGRTVVSWSMDRMHLWDAATGKEVHGFEAGGVRVTFSRDGRALASSGGGRLRVWDVNTGRALRAITGATELTGFAALFTEGPLALSGDGRSVAAELPQKADRALMLWDVATGSLKHTLARGLPAEDQPGLSTTLAFSSDGQMLAAALPQGKPNAQQPAQTTIRIWNVSTGREVRNLRIPISQITTLAFNPAGTLLAAGSARIRIFELAGGKELRTLAGHATGVSSLAFSPDGRLLASAGSRENSMKLWDVETGREVRVVGGKSPND